MYERLSLINAKLNEFIAKPIELSGADSLVEENRQLKNENALLKNEAARLKEILAEAETRTGQYLIERNSIKERVERLIQLID